MRINNQLTLLEASDPIKVAAALRRQMRQASRHGSPARRLAGACFTWDASGTGQSSTLRRCHSSCQRRSSRSLADRSGLALWAVERLKAAKRAATFTVGVDGGKIIVIMVS